MIMKWTTVFVIVFGGMVFGEINHKGNQNNPQLEMPKLNLSDPLSNLPDSIQGIDGLNLDESKIPTAEDAAKLAEEKCLKNGGPGAYEKVIGAKDDLEVCMKSFVNTTEIQQEIELAKPTGDLDGVFKKYCRKSPMLKNCVTNFTTAIDPCLEPREKESSRILLNITESLLNFICFKEGDRIALFIAEGGPECVQSQQEAIRDCINTTMSSHIPKEVPGVDQLPLLILDTKECNDLERLKVCMVEVLEQCSEPTPANIVGSLFKFVMKMTPCPKIMAEQMTAEGNTNAAQAFVHSNTLATLAATLLMAMLTISIIN